MEYMTPKQVTQRFGLTKANLAKRRHMRADPVFYKVGGSILYKRADVEALIEEGKIKPLCI